MNEKQMKEWIDSATYEQLLRRWRFAPIGSPWFQGKVGDYYSKVMFHKKEQVSGGAAVAASKAVGWEK